MRRIFLGYHAMVYTGSKNITSCIRTPGIALREPKEDGGHSFIYLYTGKGIHIDKWTELPIYGDIVKRVVEIVKREDNPL